MPDESLSAADKTIFAVAEIIAFALGWNGVDRLLDGRPFFHTCAIFAVCVGISYAGFKWPRIKATFTSRPTSEEVQRRQGLLAQLRQEYILANDSLSPALLAGAEEPPALWVNKRLVERGEKWTVSGQERL